MRSESVEAKLQGAGLSGPCWLLTRCLSLWTLGVSSLHWWIVTCLDQCLRPCQLTSCLFAGIGNALGALRTLGQACQQLGASGRQYSVKHPGGCTAAVQAATGSDEAAEAAAEQLQALSEDAATQQREGTTHAHAQHRQWYWLVLPYTDSVAFFAAASAHGLA